MSQFQKCYYFLPINNYLKTLLIYLLKITVLFYIGLTIATINLQNVRNVNITVKCVITYYI